MSDQSDDPSHDEQTPYHGATSRSYTDREARMEMFYLMMHSTHFVYGHMASNIWLRTILIVRKETRCRHIGYSYRLTARVLLYAPSHRQDNTYHGLCYTSRGALAGTKNSSMGTLFSFRVTKKHNIPQCDLSITLLLMSYRLMSFSCHITQTGWHIPLPLIHQLWRIGC